MSMPRFRNLTLALLIGFLASSRGATAQEEKLVLNPPLNEALPLELKASGVSLKFPILLNDRTILGPGATLRFVYVDTNAYLHPRGGGQGGGAPGGHHHHGGDSADGGDGGAAFARGGGAGGGPGGGGGDAPAPADTADGAKGPTSEARTEVWTQLDPFRDAFANAADQGTTFVYTLADQKKPLSVAIDLPDGMLLGEVEGHVRVLGLTSESRAAAGGVQPGDEIRSLQGSPAVATLHDFVRIYSETKEAAEKSGKPYSIQAWRTSESKLLTIEVGAPPSLMKLF